MHSFYSLVEVLPSITVTVFSRDSDRFAVLSNCHFTSIGAMVAVTGKTCIEVSSCSFPSKFCQYPKSLPNGARLSLSNGAQASIVACSPQLSVGTGCKATLVGFDHGKPGGTTGNPITGGGGIIIDLSNPESRQALDTDDIDALKFRSRSFVQFMLILLSVMALASAVDARIRQVCED